MQGQIFALSTDDRTLYITWSHDKLHQTASYHVVWEYYTWQNVWFSNGATSITVDEHNPSMSCKSTFSIPATALKVRVKVKPIAKEKTTTDANGNEKKTPYFQGAWSSTLEYNVNVVPPATPSAPTVTLDDYKLEIRLDNIALEQNTSTIGTVLNPTHIIFQIIKDDTEPFAMNCVPINLAYRQAAWTREIEIGHRYKVRCKALRSGVKTISANMASVSSGGSVISGVSSDWSDFTENILTKPTTPSGITQCKAATKIDGNYSVYLEWGAVNSASAYEVEYTTKREYFDNIGGTTTTVTTLDDSPKVTIYGLSGGEYFFRVRATNDEQGSSDWTEIVSLALGEAPGIPTTWESTSTAIAGEQLRLYWVHNSKDGSSQTKARLEIEVDGVTSTYEILNSTDEDEKDKTSMYEVDTSGYTEGTQLKWRVCTAGVVDNEFGDWSIQRIVDIYAPAVLTLTTTDEYTISEDGSIQLIIPENGYMETLRSFPFYIKAVAGPKTQTPIGYHVTISSNDLYETIDRAGNSKTVSAGEQVYSKYFDVTDDLLLEFSAGNIDLENNIEYTISCVVSMNSGLTATASSVFTVGWTEVTYIPNAEISIDTDDYSVSITPYCNLYSSGIHKVELIDDKYSVMSDVIDILPDDDSITSIDVQKGDTLYSIAQTYLGSTSKAQWLADINDIPNPNYIGVGQSIKLSTNSTLNNVYTTTGERVYMGVNSSNRQFYYCISYTDSLGRPIEPTYYMVVYNSGKYTISNLPINEYINPVYTNTGEEVRLGIISNTTPIYYAVVETATRVPDVTLAVYRRDFDGSLIEIMSGINNDVDTVVTDPHPPLDYARYRIVATTKSTGAISYYDTLPLYIGGKAIIIQWNESWIAYQGDDTEAISQIERSDSRLILPYNVDVSDNNSADVTSIKYIGRKRPVVYYGTQLGETSSWNAVIPKDDKETLYGLRRLAAWMGDVYVREPSGSGYWANISVSFSQKHLDLTIPVTLEIVRVEGGI